MFAGGHVELLVATELGLDVPVLIGQDVRTDLREVAFTQRGDHRADLYRLPDESADVSKSEPDLVERLRDEIDSRVATNGTSSDSRERIADFAPEMTKRLEDLGNH